MRTCITGSLPPPVPNHPPSHYHLFIYFLFILFSTVVDLCYLSYRRCQSGSPQILPPVLLSLGFYLYYSIHVLIPSISICLPCVVFLFFVSVCLFSLSLSPPLLLLSLTQSLLIHPSEHPVLSIPFIGLIVIVAVIWCWLSELASQRARYERPLIFQNTAVATVACITYCRPPRRHGHTGSSVVDRHRNNEAPGRTTHRHVRIKGGGGGISQGTSVRRLGPAK